MSYTTKRFAIRTIRDGRVVICGKTYRANNEYLKYDGRLDGMRYAFGRYGDECKFVSLWGTEANYLESDPSKWTPGPEEVVGHLPWMVWHEVK